MFAPVASLAAAALAFGAADVIGGSGFLAVYLVGLAVGSTPSRYRRQLVAFHEGIAFLAQVTLFIVLGLLVFPSELPSVAISGLALAVVLVLGVRPAAVWASTAFSDYTASERMLLGWAGLRGAVPIVLATFALSSDVPHADVIFNAVFFVVVVSTILQGWTLEWLAGKLKLLSPAPRTREAPLEVGDRERARPDRFRGGARPRHRRLGRARAGPAAQRDRRGGRAPAHLHPAAREHGHRSPATASSCSPREPCGPTSRTSSPAGAAASELRLDPPIWRGPWARESGGSRRSRAPGVCTTPGARIALRSSAVGAYLATRTVALGIVEAPLALAAMTEH